MNILLTSAGRRNYLVEYFRKALGGRGQVFAADATPHAPALHEADRGYIVPSIYHENYLDHVFSLCEANQVRLLIPLNDLELPLIAERRAQFVAAGTIPVVSSADIVNTCADKWATFGFLKETGLSVPRSYLSLGAARKALSEGEIRFPLVVKPRWGSASIGIEYPQSEEDLDSMYWSVTRRITRTILANLSAIDPEHAVLIQEQLHGQEYGLDVINNLNGCYITTIAKRKLVMRAGETDRAVTVENAHLQKLGEVLGRQLGHIGNLDCDVFMDEEHCYVLEMNPRFGGGYPFSHLAGLDLPAALIAWANGEEPKNEWLRVRPGIMTAKCDRLVEVSQHD